MCRLRTKAIAASAHTVPMPDSVGVRAQPCFMSLHAATPGASTAAAMWYATRESQTRASTPRARLRTHLEGAVRDAHHEVPRELGLRGAAQLPHPRAAKPPPPWPRPGPSSCLPACPWTRPCTRYPFACTLRRHARCSHQQLFPAASGLSPSAVTPAPGATARTAVFQVSTGPAAALAPALGPSSASAPAAAAAVGPVQRHADAEGRPQLLRHQHHQLVHQRVAVGVRVVLPYVLQVCRTGGVRQRTGCSDPDWYLSSGSCCVHARYRC